MRSSTEPDIVDLDDIVNFLRMHRRPRMAAMVEAWSQAERNLRTTIRLLEQDKSALVARLEVYEPPKPPEKFTPVTYKSEWD